jgi:integrase
VDGHEPGRRHDHGAADDRPPAKLGNVVKAPKTAAGRRTIPIGEDVVAALRRHRAAQREHRMRVLPAWQEHGLVFPGEIGTPVDHKAVRERFWKLCDAAGVPRIRVHDLRHTAATLMLLAGVNVKVVSERLGHASIAITLSNYAHAPPSMQRGAADALDALLRRRPAGQASG